jgi:Ulp1 family protease
MVQHVLLPVNIHFHWNLFIFEFLIIYFDIILAAILNILKTKSTTLSDGLLLLFFHTFLSARFLGDALIKLYETL